MLHCNRSECRQEKRSADASVCGVSADSDWWLGAWVDETSLPSLHLHWVWPRFFLNISQSLHPSTHEKQRKPRDHLGKELKIRNLPRPSSTYTTFPTHQVIARIHTRYNFGDFNPPTHSKESTYYWRKADSSETRVHSNLNISQSVEGIHEKLQTIRQQQSIQRANNLLLTNISPQGWIWSTWLSS